MTLGTVVSQKYHEFLAFLDCHDPKIKIETHDSSIDSSSTNS